MAERQKQPAAEVSATLESFDDFGAAFDRGRDSAVSGPFTAPDGTVVHFIGKDMQSVDAAPLFPPLPDHVIAAETVVEPASFIDYVINFKTDRAICRASLGNNAITAVLDYHSRAREAEAERSQPDHGSHTITLLCPFDADYLKWRLAFGRKLDQGELAEFIEDMVYTIGDPPAADLLEAIADLKIDRQVRFKSARNERNGTVQFAYEEVDDPKVQGTVALPEKLTVFVPVFQGGNPQTLEVRIRYRMEKGVVAFILSVPGLDKIERDAFRSIGEKVRTETNTPVFYTA